MSTMVLGTLLVFDAAFCLDWSWGLVWLCRLFTNGRLGTTMPPPPVSQSASFFPSFSFSLFLRLIVGKAPVSEACPHSGPPKSRGQ